MEFANKFFSIIFPGKSQNPQTYLM